MQLEVSKKDVDLVGIIDLSVFYNEMICLNHHNILFFSTHLFTGRLALKLVENKLSLVHKSAVFAHVHHLILWASSDPLQSTIEAHEIGKKLVNSKEIFSKFWTQLGVVNYYRLPCRCLLGQGQGK